MACTGAAVDKSPLNNGANRISEPFFCRTNEGAPGREAARWRLAYEIKHDGYRALAFKDGKDVRLVSRNNKPLTYSEVLDSLKLLAVERVVLDGEIAALDEKGRSSFQLLQTFKSSGACRWSITPSIYCF